MLSLCINGFRDSFAAMGINLTKEEVQEMVKQMDKGGDGNINYIEFSAALTKTK